MILFDVMRLKWTIIGCKNWKIHWKKYEFFNIFAESIDRGYKIELPRRGNSNEYPHSMFWTKKRKIEKKPCKPQFYLFKPASNFILLIVPRRYFCCGS